MKSEEEKFQLHYDDALVVMQGMAANSVDLILTDPPYFKVKNEPWDRQWDKPEKFIAWIGSLCEQWQRILKPNGSLYVFASPKMAARVECEIGRSFNVLNNITWRKPISDYVPPYCGKEKMRSWTPMSERIIFAEHYGADNIAKGEAGYGAKCDELRGFVFEPLRAYLDGERIKAGIRTEIIGKEWMSWKGRNSKWTTRLAGHWFEYKQWMLPTQSNYKWLRETMTRLNHGGEYLQRPYEDLRKEYEDLRKEYEDLRKEYEDLRRPFQVSAEVPYTDVWTFKTVMNYNGKHPCEKPLDMLEHMINASSRTGATVLDCFMGTGNTGVACAKLGRKFIGIDKTEKYFKAAEQRISAAYAGNFKAAISTRRQQKQQHADLFSEVE